MSVYLRKDTGDYRVDFTYLDPATNQERRFRRQTGTKLKREAEEMERKWRHEVEKAVVASEPAKNRAAFSGFALYWLNLKQADWKPSYYDSCEYVLRHHLVPFFGDVDLRSITPHQVQIFKATTRATVTKKTKKQVSEKSVNNFLGILASILESAVDWGFLEINPVRRVDPYKLTKTDITFYDKAQSDTFLAAAKVHAPDFYTFFVVAFKTGMRIGEIFALTWGDIDLVKR